MSNQPHQPILQETWRDRLYASVPYLAEFVGVFGLVFAQGWTALAQPQFVWGITAYACSLTGLVYALEPVSGAHLNPAFTLCDVLVGSTSLKKLFGYWIVQVAGACLAGKCLGELLSMKPDSEHWSQFVAEAIYTCMLCFVILNVTLAKATKGSEFYGLAIGFAYMAGGFAVGHFSGAAFNPATTIGYDIAMWSGGILHCLAYSCSQLFGAAIASGLFRLVRPEEYGREPGKLLTKCVSEFIGTFYLALTMSLNLMTKSGAAGWSAAACLMSMTYSLATASGANFNPSVTLGFLLSGRQKITGKACIAYVATQLCAGVSAGLVAGAFVWFSKLPEGTQLAADPEPSMTNLPVIVSIVAELFFTAVLVFAWLAMTTTKTDTSFFFGLTVAACTAASTQTASNPAVVASTCTGTLVHSALAGSLLRPSYRKAIYSIPVELLAGVLGSGIFRLLYRREFDESIGESMRQLGETSTGMQVGSTGGGKEHEQFLVKESRARVCGLGH